MNTQILYTLHIIISTRLKLLLRQTEHLENENGYMEATVKKEFHIRNAGPVGNLGY